MFNNNRLWLKRTLAGVLGLGILITGPISASAATSTDELIRQLQTQIATLTQKLNELKQAQAAVNTAQTDALGTLALVGDLREGMTSDEVALLQSVLANDPSIYPEGKITGYYGFATRQAVMRFQKKHGVSGTGYAGPMTKKLINEILRDINMSRDDDDEHENNGKSDIAHKFCVPASQFGSKGWKKHFKEIPSSRIYVCRNKWNDRPNHPATTTPPTGDTAAPSLTAIGVTNITNTSAIVTWTANEATADRVYIATTSPVATTSAFVTRTSLLSGTRSLNLTGLLPSTLYRFIVRSDDAAGNIAYGAEGAFTTLVTPDTTAPVLSAISAAGTSSTTANVIWTSNEPATSKVYYGTTTPLATSTAFTMTNSALITSHATPLTGLTASTTYYVIVSSADASGNTAEGGQISFTTGM